MKYKSQTDILCGFVCGFSKKVGLTAVLLCHGEFEDQNGLQCHRMKKHP